VIAHEFSHILNGDMRLNLKITATLHGLMMIGEAGRSLLDFGGRARVRSRSRDNKGAGAIALLGVGLVVLGWLGQLSGALIKSAISRQREFLADASAVQFTRNPEGIGGALRLIGGHQERSWIRHKAAHELGHLFFSQAFVARLMATHPPLEKRIQQVLPAWRGDYLSPVDQYPDAHPIDPMQALSRKLHEADTSGKPITEAEVLDPANEPGLPDNLIELAHEPAQAFGLCLAVLLDREAGVRDIQVASLSGQSGHVKASLNASIELVDQLSYRQMVSLLALLMPTIKAMSAKQFVRLKQAMAALIKADGRVDILEWSIFEFIRQSGDRHFGMAKTVAPKYREAKEVSELFSIVASRLVWCTDMHERDRTLAFGKACNTAGVYQGTLMDAPACSGKVFRQAVNALRQCYPLLMPRLIKGLVNAAKQDGVVHDHEHAMIHTIAIIWDCPLVNLD